MECSKLLHHPTSVYISAVETFPCDRKVPGSNPGVRCEEFFPSILPVDLIRVALTTPLPSAGCPCTRWARLAFDFASWPLRVGLRLLSGAGNDARTTSSRQNAAGAIWVGLFSPFGFSQSPPLSCMINNTRARVHVNDIRSSEQ